MERVHRGWIGNCIKRTEPAGDLGDFLPQVRSRANPRQGASWGRSPPEAEAKGEINV